jgi:hypothetical protein
MIVSGTGGKHPGRDTRNRMEDLMEERKPEFIEPELVKFEEKLAEITGGSIGYLVDDE